MKISDLPEEFKIYKVYLSNDEVIYLNGKQLQVVLNAKVNLIRLPDGSGINKNFIVNWKIDFEKTREYVKENQNKIIIST
jgi:hypothetical protein